MEREIELQRALEGLKDFQKVTVDKIYNILSNEKNNQNRFLVADEVGLGKTLIAKGVICKFIQKYLIEKKKSIKIVYLCSSQSIAVQNLEKLKVFKDDNISNTYNSRLTMLPIGEDVAGGIVRFIPLTPGTSLDVSNSAGQMAERIIILIMLLEIEGLKGYRRQLKNLLRHRVGKRKWEEDVAKKKLKELEKKMDANIAKRFRERLEGDSNLYNDILSYCRGSSISKDIRTDKLIGKLRQAVVEVSVEELNPDIVIMDEFQRFRNLLDIQDNESSIQIIVNKFFENRNQKIILLSATPYKLYSTSEELQNGEDHFKEFKEVIQFLLNDNKKYEEFEILWNEYSKTIGNIANISIDEAVVSKDKIELFLRNIMCRTERVVVSSSGNGLIDTSKVKPINITTKDVNYFLKCDNVSKVLESLEDRVYSPMEFYKSTPFMYSFMENYKLKKNLIKHIGTSNDLMKELRKNKEVFINRNDVSNYNELDYGSSKFNEVIEEVFDRNGAMLLWVPPSLPYYELMGAYADSHSFSKNLIFSSWEMVPRMMATLLSYESERLTIGKMDSVEHNEDGNIEPKKSYLSTGSKRFPSRRLNFSRTNSGKIQSKLDEEVSRPKNMSNMTLLYPSEYLCNIVDLKSFVGNKLTYKEIRRVVKANIESDIEKLKLMNFVNKDTNVVDKGWYWIAPIILDSEMYSEKTSSWINSYIAVREGVDEETKKAEMEHIEYIKLIFNRLSSNKGLSIEIGKIPEDLADVLTDMALGAPAILAKRTLNGFLEEDDDDDFTIWDKAYEIGNEFRLKFSEPESIGIIDKVYEGKGNYWHKVIKYCIDGNLQSVLDEYAYLLYENNRIGDNYEGKEKIIKLSKLLVDTMSLRNSSFKVDTINSVIDEKSTDSKKISMRAHYSVSFSHKSTDAKSQGRIDDVREAFNSPFRPFVITTTSIGQEGLDFHWYCRKIIHWNLPSNPVDLEQREGRINRYKGLVIRQNLAKDYKEKVNKNESVVKMWNNIFEKSKSKKEAKNDLIPYWMLQDDDKENTIKLERIVPYYPYSKDAEHLERLLKILSVYRVSLGQPRQEDMINYILKDENKDKLREINKLVINLSPIDIE